MNHFGASELKWTFLASPDEEWAVQGILCIDTACIYTGDVVVGREINGLLFSWDDAKAARNLKTHGVSFDEAALVFFDDEALIEPNSVKDGEERWHAIGSIAGLVVVFAVYTEREYDEKEAIHLISARQAEKAEHRRYFDSGGRHAT